MSVSRVREKRMHGLTGGGWKRSPHGPPRQSPTLLEPLDDKLGPGNGARGPGPQDRARRAPRDVGVLDTGMDASNPDLAPNFSRRLSRNFAPDLSDVDGPCEVARCIERRQPQAPVSSQAVNLDLPPRGVPGPW
jgi:hypothetical protein